MRRLMLALFLLLAPLTAQAGELRVTLLLPVGQESISFTLNEAESLQFWRQWNALPRGAGMVPVGDNTSYSGVRVRDDEKGHEIRLYKGVGRMGEVAKTDTLRRLERWLIAHAPPPLGPALLRALDSEVQQQPDTADLKPERQMFAENVILSCRVQAKGRQNIRARCLEEALKNALPDKDYADALEEAATTHLPKQPMQQDPGQHAN